jgi:hypothetical protein
MDRYHREVNDEIEHLAWSDDENEVHVEYDDYHYDEDEAEADEKSFGINDKADDQKD